MPKHPWVLVAGGFHKQGGMDKANLALAEYLVSEEIPVHLVTHSAEPEFLADSLVSAHLVPRPRGSFFLGAQLLDFRGRQVARSITTRWSEAQVVVNGASCIWAGVNWSHYVHHAWIPDDKNLSLLNRQAKALIHRIDRNREKTAYTRANLIVANSDTTRRHLLEHFPLNQNRVKTLYLGSDPEWGPISEGEREAARRALDIGAGRYTAAFIGAVGSDDRKGLDTVVAAWKHLSEDAAWDVDLLVAGGGRAIPVWQARISAAGLEDRIRLLGFRSNVRELLAGCDLLVSPVRYEPYGLNVQEAICRGVPAIVSASAGVAERYPRELAEFLLPDPNSAQDLARRVRLWRANIELWKNRFEPLSSELRRHTWRHMARQFVDTVQEVQGSTRPVTTMADHIPYGPHA